MTSSASKKILEVENLLQSLSDEMLKLKSATKSYEETNEKLQKVYESIEKISITHQKLTNNMTQFLVDMEKMDAEGMKTREFIQSAADELKAAVKGSLSKNGNEIRDEIRKQTDRMLEHNESQFEALRLVKYLVALGVLMEVALIIIMLFL